MKEACYYEKLDNDVVQCFLCPHHCKIMPDKAGICRVRKNIEGHLFLTSYGRISSVMLDPIEKKPLYHFLPGSYVLSVGSIGCNFHCQFCQNWAIAHQEAPTREISSDELVELCSNTKDNIGIAYTYNEPLIWYEYVLECSKKIKQAGLKNVLVTNGFIEEQPLKDLLPFVDAMNIDLKSFNNDYYKKTCKGALNPVLRTIEISAVSCHVELTTLIVPGLNDSEQEMEKLSKWVASIDKDMPLHLSRYFPSYKMVLPPTPIKTLLKLREIALNNLPYVYLGNVNGVDDNTYCPNCGNLLIDRRDIPKAVGMKKMHCLQCGLKIKGVFEED